MFKQLTIVPLILVLLTGCGLALNTEITFWNELPVMPNALEIKDRGNLQGYQIYEYTVDIDLKSAEKFYRDELKKQGWEILGMTNDKVNQMPVTTFWVSKGKLLGQVDVYLKDKITHVGLMLY